MITIPYTDLHGYKHIGAFPYGANLIMTKNGTLVVINDPKSRSNSIVNIQINANSYKEEAPIETTNVDNNAGQTVLYDPNMDVNESKEAIANKFNKKLMDRLKVKREQKEQMNPEQNLHSYTVPPKYEDFLNFNTAVASSTRVVIEQIGPPEGVLSDASKDKDSSDISTPGWVRRTE